MRRLSIICAVIAGIVFIISGLLKLLDPIGTGFIMTEYFNFLHISFLSPLSVPLGIAVSALEVILGGMMAIRFRMKQVAFLNMLMISLYTILTLVLMIFNPPMDCGCFGEAIHLTHSQTFFKNLILLVMVLLPYVYSDSVSSHAPWWRNAYRLSLLGISVVVTPLMSLLYRPFIDFTDYRPSAVIATSEESSASLSGTVSFIYEKDGRSEEFMLDNLPDSTWTYVGTVTSDLKIESTHVELPVKDSWGDYVIDQLLVPGGNYLVSVHSPESFDESDWIGIREFAARAQAAGNAVSVILSGYQGQYDSLSRSLGMPLYYCDYKTLATLNRSNGGVTYVNTAARSTIIEKWAFRMMDSIDIDKVASSDPELMLMNATMRRSAFFQVLMFIYMLLMVL